jgi:hypothetical protein
VKKPCIVCRQEFEVIRAPGRPAAICGDACRQQRTRERERKRWCATEKPKVCPICMQAFKGLGLLCGDVCRKAHRRALARKPHRVEKRAEDYAARKGKARASNRLYIEKNREQVRERLSRYYRENEASLREQSRVSKLRKRETAEQAQQLIDDLAAEIWKG